MKKMFDSIHKLVNEGEAVVSEPIPTQMLIPDDVVIPAEADDLEFRDFGVWAAAQKREWPECVLHKGDGYGEPNDWTALVGPDMQADVVGTWSAEDNLGYVIPRS